MTVFRYYSILSEFVVLLPFHPSIDSAAAQDEIQSGCFVMTMIYLMDPNHSKSKVPLLPYCSSSYQAPLWNTRREAWKGAEAAKFLQTRGRRSWIVFSFRERGGQNPLKTLSEDGDGNEKWCGWMSYNQCLEGFEELLCLTTDESKIE